MKKYLPYILLIMLIALSSRQANAAMTNGNYTIDKRDVEIQPYSDQAPEKSPVPTHKMLAEGNNFQVDTNKPEAFSFSLSQNIIDFGRLTATNPVTRELGLSLSSRYGYQVETLADHPLTKTDGTPLPDTTCDNGACSEVTSAPWNSILTYGFGYRTSTMAEDDYKQFADNSHLEGFKPILDETSTKDTIKITYKANVSTSQQPGSYSNTIIYLASPDF